MTSVSAVQARLRPAERARADDHLPMREWPWLDIMIALFTILLLIAAGKAGGGTIYGLNAISIALILITASVVLINLWSYSPEHRAARSLITNLAILVSIPVTRLPHNRQTLLVTAAAIAAIGLATLLSPSTRSPSGWYVFSGLFLMLAIVSEFSPDSGALKVLLIIFVSASTAFGLAGRLSGRDLQRASLVIIAMALLESVIAAIEPFAFPTHLWVPAQTDPITGFIVPLHNGLLGGERSQGTFGHPLPLGVLLALGVGLVVRQAGIALAHRVWIIAILLVGLAFADDQNSTLMVAVLLLFFSTRRVSGVRVLFGVAAAGSAVLAAIATSILTSAKVHDFYASGSYTHRVGAYDSIPKLLFQQPFHAVLFGNGTGSTERIFSEGLLQTDGLQAIDNQFVALLSQGGLVAATLLAVLCVLAVIVCPGPLRPALLVVVATLFVFDSFLWPSASALTATVLGAALSRQVVPRFGRTARAVGARPGESTG